MFKISRSVISVEMKIQCSICGKEFSAKDIDSDMIEIGNHMLAHINQVDIFDLFNNVGDYCVSDKFDNRKEDIQEIVNELYWYDEFKDFDRLYNEDDGWIGTILECAWEVLDHLDDEWNWGEQEIARNGKLRQSIAKTVHKYVTEITKERLFQAVTGILVLMDWWKEEQFKENNDE